MRPYGTDVWPVDAASVKGFYHENNMQNNRAAKNGQISKNSQQHDISQQHDSEIFILYFQLINQKSVLLLKNVFCYRLTFLAKFDTSYCTKPCWCRVLRARWYISEVASSTGTLTSPLSTCLKSSVPRSKVSWYSDTWSSHTPSSSDSSFSQDSTLCPGLPNMTSTDTLPGQSLRASSIVCKASRELWSLPRIFKSSSRRD